MSLATWLGHAVRRRRSAAPVRAVRRWYALPARRESQRREHVRAATERYLMYVLLPAWFVPAVFDYVMHRRTRIEETSGTRESLVHIAMMGQIGAAAAVALFLELTAASLTLMMGTVVVHTATSFLDTKKAVRGGREFRPNEMHLHSLLEVLPFMATSFMICLHPERLRAFIGRGTKDDWQLRLKRPRMRVPYLLGLASAFVACLVLPYGEELRRCLRAGRHRSHETQRSATRANDGES